MRTSPLGDTDIEVSRICLGTMTYGQQNTRDEGFEQMDYALDRGINFFDTAELYAIPPKPETQGATEAIIGEWFAARKSRDKVILATKVVGRSTNTWFRDNGAPARLTPPQMREALEKSLKRLQTDYIDLYQLHWPDRPINGFGGVNYEHIEAESEPIERTLDTLNTFIHEGKVRHIGISNETPWGTMKFLHAAEQLGLPRIVSIQNVYNLVSRVFEQGLSEIAMRENVGLLAYSPLGQGVLTGKYLNGARPAGSRKQLFDRIKRYETPRADDAIARYVEIARKHGLDPAQMALKFCDTRPFVTSTIIGATKMDQLKTNIAAFDIDLPDGVITDIEQAHILQPNPCP